MSDSGAVPSRLPDLLRDTIAVLVQAGLADYPHVDGSGKIEILTGERYKQQEGASRRILFIPGDGKIEGAFEISANQIASRASGCEVYVWGLEHEDDLRRYDDADQILEDLVAALQVCAEARLTSLLPMTVKRMRDTDINTFGEEYRVEFTYGHEVPRSRAIERAARALFAGQSKSPQDPDRPEGSTGKTFHQVVHVENKRTGT